MKSMLAVSCILISLAVLAANSKFEAKIKVLAVEMDILKTELNQLKGGKP